MTPGFKGKDLSQVRRTICAQRPLKVILDAALKIFAVTVRFRPPYGSANNWSLRSPDEGMHYFN
jgi:hypothetical protein